MRAGRGQAAWERTDVLDMKAIEHAYHWPTDPACAVQPCAAP